LQEYRDAGLLFRIIRNCVHKHADPPHAVFLLRPRREGARSGATERRDELATVSFEGPTVACLYAK
jgi:hypothetical protein